MVKTKKQDKVDQENKKRKHRDLWKKMGKINAQKGQRRQPKQNKASRN